MEPGCDAPAQRLDRIGKGTRKNKLQLLFRKPITKNSKVKRAWHGAMWVTDREVLPGWRMSEHKVRRKDMCWSVGDILSVLESLSGVGGPGLGEAGGSLH
jgi:hypothetical protein